MIIYLIVSLFLGTIIGLFALIPNLHINNILPIFDLANINPVIKGISIIFGSILFTFLSNIVIFFLMVPNQDNFVLTSSANDYYKKGKSYYAIYLATLGSLYSFLISIPIIIIFIIIIEGAKESINYITLFVLILVIITLFFSIRNIFGLLIIIFSSLIGLVTLQGSLDIKNPILVLISGLFAVSSLYTLYYSRTQRVVQMDDIARVNFIDVLYVTTISLPLSVLATLFAGLGSGVASYFGSKIARLSDDLFVIMNSSINLLILILSFFMAIAINKVRTGASYYFLNYSNATILENKLFIFAIIFISVILSVIITLYLSKIIIYYFSNIDYKLIFYFSSLCLLFVILIFSNYLGYIIFIVSSLIGILCTKSENPKILMMSSIIIPVIFFFYTL